MSRYGIWGFVVSAWLVQTYLGATVGQIWKTIWTLLPSPIWWG